MKFDFRYAKGNTVEVNENFNEASLKVKLKGKSDLDKNTLKVTINDKEMKYDASKYMVHILKIKTLVFQLQVWLKTKHLRLQVKQ